MIYKVSADEKEPLSLNETDTVRSILQNIRIILTTRKGSVPLYREFGLDMGFLDRPEPLARVMMISQVKEAIEEFEPRVRVTDIVINSGGNGKLTPVVEVEIIGQSE